MSPVALRHKESQLIEILLSGLDLRAMAGAADSAMLVYLAELLVERARDELDAVAELLESRRPRAEE